MLQSKIVRTATKRLYCFQAWVQFKVYHASMKIWPSNLKYILGLVSTKTFKLIVLTNNTTIGCYLCVFIMSHSVLEWIYALQLPECQGTGWSKQTWYQKFKWFTVKHVYDVVKTYCQMHHTNKYSQQSSIIWPVWLNGWVFVYELGGRGFQSRCNHLNFQYCVRFKLAVLWHSGNYRV